MALHPLDVRVHEGEFFGVFGPNGAGKSTFIKLLTGQLVPASDASRCWASTRLRTLSTSRPTSASCPNRESPPSFLTPPEFLTFVAKLRGLEDVDGKVDHWLSWFGLEEKRDTMCKDLSKGQRQKVMLASAFIHAPKLLFLDEPFATSIPFTNASAASGCSNTWPAAGRFSCVLTCLNRRNVSATGWPSSTKVRSLAAGAIDDLKLDGESLEDVFIRLRRAHHRGSGTPRGNQHRGGMNVGASVRSRDWDEVVDALGHRAHAAAR